MWWLLACRKDADPTAGISPSTTPEVAVPWSPSTWIPVAVTVRAEPVEVRAQEPFCVDFVDRTVDDWGRPWQPPVFVDPFVFSLVEAVGSPDEFALGVARGTLTLAGRPYTVESGDLLVCTRDLRANAEPFDEATLVADAGTTWVLTVEDIGGQTATVLLVPVVEGGLPRTQLTDDTLRFEAVADWFAADVLAEPDLLDGAALATAPPGLVARTGELFVARLPFGDLGAVNVADLRAVAERWFSLELPADPWSVDLSEATDPSGVAFPGVNDQGVWVVGAGGRPFPAALSVMVPD